MLKDIYWKAILVCLLMVSYFTTYTGIISYLGGFGNVSLINMALFAVVVTLVQGLLVWCLLIALSEKYPMVFRWMTIVGYLLFMSISVFFSYAFYYDNLRADSFAVSVYKKEVEVIKANADTYQKKFEEIGFQVDKLAKISSDKATKEDKVGGTCDGKPAKGKGKFNFLRNSEQTHFKKIAKEVGALVTRVEAQIAAFEKKLKDIDESALGNSEAVQNQEIALNKLLKEINKMPDSIEMQEILQRLDSHSGENRKRLVVNNPFNDYAEEEVSCPDAEINEAVKIIQAKVEKLEPIDETVELFDPNDKKEVISRALLVFADFFGIDLEDSGDKSEKTPEITGADYYPLIGGIFVDLMIFFVGVLGIYVKQYNEPDPIETKAYLESPHTTLDRVEKYVHHTAWGVLLVLPNIAKRPSFSTSSTGVQAVGESSDKDVKKLKLICSTNRRFRLVASDVPTKDLPSSLQKKYESSNIPSVTIYSLSATNWKRFVVSLL